MVLDWITMTLLKRLWWFQYGLYLVTCLAFINWQPVGVKKLCLLTTQHKLQSVNKKMRKKNTSLNLGPCWYLLRILLSTEDNLEISFWNLLSTEDSLEINFWTLLSTGDSLEISFWNLLSTEDNLKINFWNLLSTEDSFEISFWTLSSTEDSKVYNYTKNSG